MSIIIVKSVKMAVVYNRSQYSAGKNCQKKKFKTQYFSFPMRFRLKKIYALSIFKDFITNIFFYFTDDETAFVLLQFLVFIKNS